MSSVKMLKALVRESGFRKRRLVAALRAWAGYKKDKKDFLQALEVSGQKFAWGRELPILTEKQESSGSLGAYLLQDLTVARWIREDAPSKHFDVGSRIDGFVTNVAAFREIEVIDIRPAPGEIPGVVFHQCDVMGSCPAEWLAAMPSLSCLHTIEHFGLGRYGDPIDALGYEKGLAALKSMVMPGGMLYLSTPIGPQRVEFNAHRIFAVETLLNWFAEGWELVRFAVIDDEVKLHPKVVVTETAIADHFGCQCGVGIVAVRKKADLSV